MTLDEYEAAASRTTNPALDATGRLVDSAAGLAEEAGEVLGLVRKYAYQARELDKDRLKEELGDSLWCLAMVARSAGMSLETIAVANLAKLKERHPTR